ncbi:MAG: prolipoprotein diacylglyceryl transferase [Desulfobulbus propionicus]|nr:MAG: prolipoprotein diacylglyceryl transferase [Desulfobulbus propionicus]
MIAYPEIDPVILSIGPLAVRWYGLMYVIGFIAAYTLVAYQAKRFGWLQLRDHLDNLNMSLILGVILGGRLGYVLFYNLQYYLSHPVEIFSIWQGGMSFHGGCIGALLAGFSYSLRHKLDFWKAADLYVVTVPIGLFFGRIGNFINAELFGRVTDVHWGMIFPGGGPLPRHPSQLYEAFLEGILLFCILWAVKNKPWKTQSRALWPHGTLLGLFLILYSLFRFTVEFVREPDPQIGLLFASVSMGQVLSSVMCCMGMGLWYWRIRTTQHQ